MKRFAAASLLTVTLALVAAAPSAAGHGARVIIGGPAFYWGPPYYPYPPPPYYDWRAVAERKAMAQLRLTSEPALLSGCTRLGSVKDDDVADLRRKIVRAGGNAAALSFGVDDLDFIQADVYRCTTTAKAPSSTSTPSKSATPPPPPPAGTPPPPAGTPPPPPPPAEPTR